MQYSPNILLRFSHVLSRRCFVCNKSLPSVMKKRSKTFPSGVVITFNLCIDSSSSQRTLVTSCNSPFLSTQNTFRRYIGECEQLLDCCSTKKGIIQEGHADTSRFFKLSQSILNELGRGTTHSTM
nr:hypothetical protein Iba_chr02aCG23390 [Ipomoea batatas]GMC61743.1 hypothetical protein Iba_chr02bCG22940 [Ipomoea batatas]GMC65616.1 hypothetical protein Iba_chr02dCG15790 [Ipomoea batatas]GMD45598.1 hypothetical protein Iba_scaffold1331590CG0010 [Ipomoea batatas]GMD83924.1 hypothetical protein Iba_scaffold1587509CG0010 [Ipomoea batatas]